MGWLPSAAAVLALLVGSGILYQWWRGPPASEDTERGSASSEVRPTDGATMIGGPQTFSWPAELGATGYRVRLMGGEGTLIWESEPVVETRLAPPETLDWSRGSDYLWTVEVEGPVTRTRLGPYRFRIQ